MKGTISHYQKVLEKATCYFLENSDGGQGGLVFLFLLFGNVVINTFCYSAVSVAEAPRYRVQSYTLFCQQGGVSMPENMRVYMFRTNELCKLPAEDRLGERGAVPVKK